MKEYDFINNLLKGRRRSPAQLNNAFESDAEIIAIDGKQWAITVDEFSEEEDFLIHKDPQITGWNLAVATLSDLFACGVKPEFYMQTILMSNAKTEFFYEKLMEGIYSALKSCNCFLLGGDTGYDNAWRYAGIALGRSIQNEAITRVIKKKCDFDIWITGTCGDSNLAILTDQEIPRFEIRTEEAESTSKYALACTDSSGGFCDAVWNLKKVNPYFDFEINLDTMPYAHDLKKISREMKLPMELALIGGAGEYELLILAPRELENKFQKNPTMQKVGTGYPTANKGCVKFFKGNLQAGAMREEPPCYRSCKKEDYLRTTIEYYNNNFTKIS